MKYLIVTDIHGDAYSCKFICDKFKNDGFDKMLLLGDVLYHGPRNDLPQNYNPKAVIKALNPYANKITCIKGNCEAEVDQMVLDFKINDYLDLNLNGYRCHLEHGHHLDLYKGSPDIVFYGHTHISKLDNKDNTYYINPGSITIPKENTSRSYIIFDDNKITAYSMDNNKVFDLVLKK